VALEAAAEKALARHRCGRSQDVVLLRCMLTQRARGVNAELGTLRRAATELPKRRSGSGRAHRRVRAPARRARAGPP
jgi:hypothetical protein